MFMGKRHEKVMKTHLPQESPNTTVWQLQLNSPATLHLWNLKRQVSFPLGTVVTKIMSKVIVKPLTVQK